MFPYTPTVDTACQVGYCYELVCLQHHGLLQAAQPSVTGAVDLQGHRRCCRWSGDISWRNNERGRWCCDAWLLRIGGRHMCKRVAVKDSARGGGAARGVIVVLWARPHGKLVLWEAILKIQSFHKNSKKIYKFKKKILIFMGKFAFWNNKNYRQISFFVQNFPKFCEECKLFKNNWKNYVKQ